MALHLHAPRGGAALRAVALAALAALAGACSDADDEAGETLADLSAAATVCPDGPTLDGIDVSFWQGNIDWPQVAGAGVEFAFIRVTHGLGTIDTKFAQNWAGARANGIVRGPYHYFQPEQDALEQADLFLELLGPLEADDLPPVIDVESTGGLSAEAILAGVQTWIDRVEAATGKRVIIYTGKYFWQDNVAASPQFLDHLLWVPQYDPICPDVPAPWTTWAFFQHSSTGSVAGITGNVDLDQFNGDMAALMAIAHGVVACGDDVCNGDETPDSCAQDCPRCEPVPAAGRVIDERDVCTELGGTATAWRRVTDAGWESSLLWTHATDWDAADNFARWSLDLAQAGRYRVEAYTPATHAQSRAATYAVRHAGTEDLVPVDQTSTDGWAALGEFDFAAGADQWIYLGDNTGEALSTNTQVVFDAVRLTRVDGPGDDPLDPPGGNGNDAPIESGGCTIATRRAPGATSWPGGLGLLAPLALLALRRRRPKSGAPTR